MIRTAFVGLIALAGLLAFGAFYLGRGSGEDVVSDVAEIAAEVETPVVTAPPVATPLYYLSEIDLTSGEIALVFFDEGNGEAIGVLRDTNVLAAAKTEAALPAVSPEDIGGSGFRLLSTAAALVDTYAQIYRDDLLIASIECSGDACTGFDGGPGMNDAGLRAAALPLARVDDTFDTYDDYLATIDAISRDPFYMFLHGRRLSDPFPVDRIIPTLRLALPTVTTPASSPLDISVHEAALEAVLAAALPEGASLTAIEITSLGTGVVGDTDSGTPTLAGGAPIPYPDVLHYSVTVDIAGISDLSADTLDALSSQTARRYDYAADFADFTRDRLQSSCTDCFEVLVEGANGNTARIIDSRAELYRLTYFDLREAP